MSKYVYEGVNLEGHKIKGKYECENIEKLKSNFREKGFFITYYREMKGLKLKKRFSLKESAMFCKQLHDLLSSGINVLEALNIMTLQSKDDFSKNVFLKLAKDVSKGNSLYESIKESHELFPNFIILMTKVGEESGNLEEIFKKLYEHYYYRYELKSKITKALVYPIITFIFFVIAVIFLRLKVLPIFINMIRDLGGDIPIFTKVFMITFDNGLIILLSILIFMVVSVFNKESFIKSIKFKLPFIGQYFIKWEQIKFIESFNVLVNSGMDIVKIMEIIIDSTNNLYIKNKYKSVLENIERGESLHKALENMDMYESYVLSMISIGEISGNLESCTENIGRVLNNDFNCKLDKITEIIEPILIVIISIFVGSMLVAVLLPILNMTNSISL